MDPMLESFLQESRENLESVGRCFLEIEKDAGDDEIMNDLFRSIHTIKGSSGLFDIAPLTRVVHAAEDVLDVAREGNFTLNSDHIDLFLDSMDQVGAWLDDLEDSGGLGGEAEGIGQVLAEKLRALLGETESSDDHAETKESHVPSSDVINEVPDWFYQVPDDVRLSCFADSSDDENLFAIEYTPDKQCFFNGDDPIHTVKNLEGLRWFKIEAKEEWEELLRLDPFHCNLVIKMVVSGKESTIREYFRYVAEQINITQLKATQFVFPVGELGDGITYDALIKDATAALEVNDFDTLKKCIGPLLEIGSADLIQTSALAWILQLLRQQYHSKDWLNALIDSMSSGEFSPPNHLTLVGKADPHDVDKSVDNSANDATESSKATVTFKKIVSAADVPESTQKIFDTQLRILGMPCPEIMLMGRIKSTVKLLGKLYRQLGWEGLVVGLDRAGNQSEEQASCQPLADYLQRCINGDEEQHIEVTQKYSSHTETMIAVEDVPAATQQLFSTQLRILGMPCPEKMLVGRIKSTVKLLNKIFKQLGWDQWITELDAAAQNSLSATTCEPLELYLKQCVTDELKEPSSNEQIKESKSEQVEKLEGNQHKTEQAITEVTKAPAQTHVKHNRRATDKAESNVSSKPASKTLRVDQERIDTLMDLVGELVVAKNSLPFLARRAEEEYKVKELGKEIKAQYSVINRLAEELQSAMMSVRMVPVSSVFQRFPRLVRDLSRRLEKNIELVMEGEETEADKNVIENLADPLIHLVRNSLDHGIEMPADRVAAGKPEKGTLTLRATPMDDQVIIEIIDDGKGIDPNVIKQKAYEKGVINEAKLESISDQEAIELIFAAGLSSKDEASDLSGRGVGMDVVRTAVNDAGGQVSLISELGKGSTLRLSLPLSMAVAQVMMIEVDNQTYGVSMENIRETVRVPTSTIQRVKQNEAIILRDKLIPLRRMRKLLNLPSAEKILEEEAVLIVSVNGEEIGLIIDDFLEGIDVIQKPLEGVMSSFPMYAGATLLGDGRVLLILNLAEII